LPWGEAVSDLVLSAEGLVKRFGAKEAVRSVDLELRPAEVVGLLGPNGAGKTTIFNMIAGNTRVTSGRVHLGDREITGIPAEAQRRDFWGHHGEADGIRWYFLRSRPQPPEHRERRERDRGHRATVAPPRSGGRHGYRRRRGRANGCPGPGRIGEPLVPQSLHELLRRLEPVSRQLLDRLGHRGGHMRWHRVT